MKFFFTRVNWGFIWSATCRFGHVCVTLHKYQKRVSVMRYQQF